MIPLRATLRNRAQAFEHLRMHRPHCILLDYNMPHMNGLQVLKAVRAEPRYPGIPVILCTALPGVEEAVMAAGADGFVVKVAHDWDTVMRVLRQFCEPTCTPDEV